MKKSDAFKKAKKAAKVAKAKGKKKKLSAFC